MVKEKSVTASDHVDHRLGDQELMPRVEGVLQIANCKWGDLTQIACVIGPGGFMSLRVGVALANTLADQLKIPIAGVHLSDLYATRISNEQVAGSNYVWLHSTKKQELFVRGFGSYAKQWPEATHVQLKDFINVMPQPMHWVGELIPEHQAALAVVGALRAMPLHDVEEILPAFLQHQEFKKQILEPWYGRGW